jgi:hypothetical protein
MISPVEDVLNIRVLNKPSLFSWVEESRPFALAKSRTSFLIAFGSSSVGDICWCPNLIPHFRYVKTKCISVSDLRYFYFSFCQPSAVRKRKFHFVSVKNCFWTKIGSNSVLLFQYLCKWFSFCNTTVGCISYFAIYSHHKHQSAQNRFCTMFWIFENALLLRKRTCAFKFVRQPSPGTTLGINTTLPSGLCNRYAFCTSIKDFYLMKDNFVCIFLSHGAK